QYQAGCWKCARRVLRVDRVVVGDVRERKEDADHQEQPSDHVPGLAPRDDETDEKELQSAEHQDSIDITGSLPGRNTCRRANKDVDGKREIQQDQHQPGRPQYGPPTGRVHRTDLSRTIGQSLEEPFPAVLQRADSLLAPILEVRTWT